MGLFKDVLCAECGAKTNIAMRMKLADGNYVCSKCKKAFPSYLEGFAKEKYGIDDFKNVKQWQAESISQYSGIFNVTKSYGELSIDGNNGLFTLGFSTGGGILKFEDILDFDFAFNPEEYKDGLIGGKVKGDTHFCVTVKQPAFYYETTLEFGAKASAKKSFFGNKVTYEHPKKLVDFETQFIEAYIKFMPENTNNQQDELKQAMTLFMIDDLAATDVNGLSSTRDALLQSFQNGNSERQINMINSAFDLLKDKVGK